MSNRTLEAISLFAGIGGAAYGMQQTGIRVKLSVECDPGNLWYSEDCRDMHDINFSDGEFWLNKVEDVAHLLEGCDVLQASTVCSNFSQAKKMNNKDHGESEKDILAAQKTAEAIERTNTTHFWLEQVREYRDSISLDIIVKKLMMLGFKVLVEDVNFADYAIAQDRKRLILLASKEGYWSLPPKAGRVIGWQEAILGIPLEPATLTDRQWKEVKAKIDDNWDLERGVLIARYGRNISIRQAHEPSWTITRSILADNKGGRRLKVINVLRRDGVWALPIRAIARLCGFDDEFEIGKYGGEGLGYAVPPKFARQLMATIPGGIDNA